MGWAKLAATKKVKEAMAALEAHGTAVGLDLDLGDGIWAKGTKAEPHYRPRPPAPHVVPYIHDHDHAHRGAVLSTCTPSAERYLRKTDKLKSPRHRRGSPEITSSSGCR